MSNPDQNIQFFRRRRHGPEAKIEDSVVSRLDKLFPLDTNLSWTAGSLPIGAGVPDIMVVAFRPEVYALCNVNLPKSQLLAYLRAIPRARAETIADRLKQPREILIRCLQNLVEFEIVQERGGVYQLSECWKDILPDITTVEVKVSDWKKAVVQASRNRVFAHRSYIAMPHGVALRIKDHELFKLLGIGILSVDQHGGVNAIRLGRRCQPRVWDYYYKIAELTAQHVSGRTDAVYSEH